MVKHLMGINPNERNVKLVQPTIDGNVNLTGGTNIAVKDSQNAFNSAQFFQEGVFIEGTDKKLNFMNAGNQEAVISLDSNNKLNFYNNDSSKRLTIQSDGKIGIGIDSPLALLHISHSDSPALDTTSIRAEGALSLYDFHSDAHLMCQLRPTGTGGQLYLCTNANLGNINGNINTFFGANNENNYINNGGNVGIGTDNPQSKLHIAHSTTQSSGTDSLRVEGDIQTYAFNVDLHKRCKLSSDALGGKLSLRNGYVSNGVDNTVVRVSLDAESGVHNFIDNGGNVGIGNNAPDYKLLVEDDSNSSLVRIKNTSNGWLNIGCRNISFCHIETDRPSFYMNTNLQTVGNVSPYADDTYDLGLSNKRWDDIYATSGVINTSDKREKTDIEASNLGLSFINKLRPVSYRLKNKARTHYGLIAQEVKDALSKEDISFNNNETNDFAGYCYTKAIEKEGKKYAETYGLRYNEFISPMIKAIQELSSIVEQLQKKIHTLK